MRRRTNASRALTSLALAALLAGCSHLAPFDLGALPEPADGDGDGDGGGDGDALDGGDSDEDSDADCDGADLVAPRTFLVDPFVFVADPVCDVDGDGHLDNAFGDLPDVDAALLLMALNSVAFEQDNIMHLFVTLVPLADPEGLEDGRVAVLFDDGAVPAGVGEDGMDAFWVTDRAVDSCGEPTQPLEGGVACGELTARGDSIDVHLFQAVFPLVLPELGGALAPEGTAIDLHSCQALRARDAGAVVLSGTFAGHTLLEVLLSGGALLGLSVSGLMLDLDLDRDGLEQIRVDAEGRVLDCTDGDGTRVAGADCWQDPRIADAISVTATLHLRPSRLLGVHPAHGWGLESTCSGFPPADSLWGSCGDGVCERWEPRDCDGSCSGGSAEACAFDCSGFGPCLPTDAEARAPSSCADLAFEAGASCSGSLPSVSLFSEEIGRGGVWLPPPVVVGSGPVVLEARVRASSGGATEPAGGFGLSAYIGDEGPWLASTDRLVGFDSDRRGYAAQWLYRNGASGPHDRVVLRYGMEGLAPDESLVDEDVGPGVLPELGPASGPVEQWLRLVISPDLPETEEDELAVEAEHSADGVVWSSGVTCYGTTCPVRVSEGDELRVGAYGSSGGTDVQMEMPAPTGLTARFFGACL